MWSPGTHQLTHTAVIMSYSGTAAVCPWAATVTPIVLRLQFCGGNRSCCVCCSIAVPHKCCVFPPRLSLTVPGSICFATRSDLIAIGLFIGNRFILPLSDRTRFSFRNETSNVKATERTCPSIWSPSICFLATRVFTLFCSRGDILIFSCDRSFLISQKMKKASAAHSIQ